MPDHETGERLLHIACGSSCRTKSWSNHSVTFEALCRRLGRVERTAETAAQYKTMPKEERDSAKDHGGFVGGLLREGERKRETVVSRSLLTLDADDAEPGFYERFCQSFPYAACVYSTHSHTPEAPRLRIVVPLSRDVSTEEFNAVSRLIAAEWGMEQFDACSFRPHQLMYWPTAPADGEFLFHAAEGPLLDPDAFLAAFPDWRDVSLLPVSSREKQPAGPRGGKRQDPLLRGGAAGLFNRAYTVEQAIDTFLKDVYKRSAVPGRYDYIPGKCTAGLVIYEHRYACSFHATDPACGGLMDAFDLVRTHLFPDEDVKRAYRAMKRMVLEDPKVKQAALLGGGKAAGGKEAELPKVRFDAEEDWRVGLTIGEDGHPEDSLHNLQLICRHDPVLRGIVFNSLADGLEILGEVPWKHPSRFWRDTDDAQLLCYLDDCYGEFSRANFETALTKAADDRSYHPVREMFERLPVWDGVPRVETLLPDYLGAEDSPYVRAVTRKALCAAYYRVYRPGTKFDHMLVLSGGQGIGKSTLIARLGMDWFSDSLSLSDINDKTGAEKLQGYWLIEIGELAGMRKADVNRVKSFLSSTDDRYRASFGRRVASHPRQCVFFGTTNEEGGYLRDVTGNRRFWNVQVSGRSPRKPWELTAEEVRQIWAEVKVIAARGETLYLEPELNDAAEQEQREAMECDDREGLVRAYLERLLPAGWEQMDLSARRAWLRGDSFPGPVREGTERRTRVCAMEIWCECFGMEQGSLQKADSYAISAIMVRIAEWEKGAPVYFPLYGKQRPYLLKTEQAA